MRHVRSQGRVVRLDDGRRTHCSQAVAQLHGSVRAETDRGPTSARRSRPCSTLAWRAQSRLDTELDLDDHNAL
eukprot:11108350-Heterocapsa_arctica.AAC.1